MLCLVVWIRLLTCDSHTKPEETPYYSEGKACPAPSASPITLHKAMASGGWQQHYEYIKDKTGLELDKAVLDRLISECVMLIRDREEIDKPETQYKRNRVLLDILYNRPFPTFDIFIKVLVSVDPNHSDVESLQQRTRGSPDQCPYNRLPFANCKDVSDDIVKLHKMYSTFVRDIDDHTMSSILDHLIEDETLSTEEKEKISSFPIAQEKTRCLLSKIERKGRKGIESFEAALAYSYEELLQGMKTTNVTYWEKLYIKKGLQSFKERRERDDKNDAIIPYTRDLSMSTTRGCSILQHGCPRLDTSIESNRFDIITTGVKDGECFKNEHNEAGNEVDRGFNEKRRDQIWHSERDNRKGGFLKADQRGEPVRDMSLTTTIVTPVSQLRKKGNMQQKGQKQTVGRRMDDSDDEHNANVHTLSRINHDLARLNLEVAKRNMTQKRQGQRGGKTKRGQQQSDDCSIS